MPPGVETVPQASRYYREESGMSRRLVPLMFVLFALGVGLAACGGGGNSSSSESTTTASETGGKTESKEASEKSETGSEAELAKSLEAWYTGENFGEPPTEPLEVPKGKKAWLIACGNEIPNCTNVWEVFEEAGKKFGWDITKVDGKQDPSIQGNAVRQAIAAGAEVIGISSIDCSAVKQPLEEAKKAGIKIISSTGIDCDPPLFEAENLVSGAETYEEALEQLGGIEGEWVSSKVNPTGGGQVIVEKNPFTEAGEAISRGGEEALKKYCPNCEIIPLVLNAGDFVPPKAQEKTQALLTKYPEAKALVALTDDVILNGVGAAIQASGRSDEDFFVASGAASPQGIELMRQNSPQVDFNVGISTESRGYELFDGAASLLDGKEPVESGNAWQAFDKERGLPKGEEYEAPVNFKADYEKRWGLAK
ncbi:MAG: sugar ABC transporter substrate-binding protein [Actinobacteria bacterium]|nr:sugar ABC transporter substrate-binding protein [Actinomycetota bacterium]